MALGTACVAGDQAGRSSLCAAQGSAVGGQPTEVWGAQEAAWGALWASGRMLPSHPIPAQCGALQCCRTGVAAPRPAPRDVRQSSRAACWHTATFQRGTVIPCMHRKVNTGRQPYGKNNCPLHRLLLSPLLWVIKLTDLLWKPSRALLNLCSFSACLFLSLWYLAIFSSHPLIQTWSWNARGTYKNNKDVLSKKEMCTVICPEEDCKILITMWGTHTGHYFHMCSRNQHISHVITVQLTALGTNRSSKHCQEA